MSQRTLIKGGTVVTAVDTYAADVAIVDGKIVAIFGDGAAPNMTFDVTIDAKAGRAIRINPKEATLQRSRARQSSAAWKEHYRATRPKVERKLAHLMLRRHGGRRARVRGSERTRQDFAMLAAAHNLARLARLGVHRGLKLWTR